FRQALSVTLQRGNALVAKMGAINARATAARLTSPLIIASFLHWCGGASLWRCFALAALLCGGASLWRRFTVAAFHCGGASLERRFTVATLHCGGASLARWLPLTDAQPSCAVLLFM